MNNASYHTPVMLEETARYLIGNESGKYVDCTIGGGGHSSYLLNKYPGIQIIGFDRDEAAVEEAEKNLANYTGRFQIFRENFGRIREVLETIGVKSVDGVLADLGVSSRQLDDPDKGFSFRSDNLDMRMDSRLEKSAEDIVNTFDAGSLAEIFLKYGEERFADRISRKIVEERNKSRITSGKQLAEIVEKVKRRDGPAHPSTKIFQALRIAVNAELDNLSLLLEELPHLLNPGGRAVIISYHSLEDRLVKNSFRDNYRGHTYGFITKKVVMPARDELRKNGRARSAKLRAAEKI